MSPHRRWDKFYVSVLRVFLYVGCSCLFLLLKPAWKTKNAPETQFSSFLSMACRRSVDPAFIHFSCTSNFDFMHFKRLWRARQTKHFPNIKSPRLSIMGEMNCAPLQLDAYVYYSGLSADCDFQKTELIILIVFQWKLFNISKSFVYKMYIWLLIINGKILFENYFK